MATTDFVSGTTITADWLNDVDAFVYGGTINVPVEIRTDSSNASVISYRTNAVGSDFYSIRFEADAATASSIVLGKSRGATIADYTVAQTNDVLGRIIFVGSNGTGVTSGVQIAAIVDSGTPGATSMPGLLKFYTTPNGSTTLNVRQVIDSDGNVAIGSSDPVAGRTFTISKTMTGATGAYGCINAGIIQADVTTSAFYYSTLSDIADSASCTSVYHYHAAQGTFGAGSTVTTQYGFIAASSLTSATNNYGFYSNLPADSFNDWNFYAAGTAPNYFAGQTTFGSLFGYASTSGDATTQDTNKATGVTINKPTGKITMNAAALGNNTTVSFTVNNSVVTADDVIITNIRSGGTAGAYLLTVDAVAAGSFRISLRNESGGSLSEAVVINFAVIKGDS